MKINAIARKDSLWVSRIRAGWKKGEMIGFCFLFFTGLYICSTPFNHQEGLQPFLIFSLFADLVDTQAVGSCNGVYLVITNGIP